MSNPDGHSKWPTNYNLVIHDGKAVLDRDFFPTCCPSQLDDAWAARTVHFRPFFEQAAVTAGIVNRDHECGTNTPKNIALWKATAQKIILGKKYRDSMKSGWNKALENLTTKNQDNEAKGEGKHMVDFCVLSAIPFITLYCRSFMVSVLRDNNLVTSNMNSVSSNVIK